MSVYALESAAYKQVWKIKDGDDMLSKFSNRDWRLSRAVFMIRHLLFLFSVAAIVGYDTSAYLSAATRAPHWFSISW